MNPYRAPVVLLALVFLALLVASGSACAARALQPPVPGELRTDGVTYPYGVDRRLVLTLSGYSLLASRLGMAHGEYEHFFFDGMNAVYVGFTTPTAPLAPDDVVIGRQVTRIDGLTAEDTLILQAGWLHRRLMFSLPCGAALRITVPVNVSALGLEASDWLDPDIRSEAQLAVLHRLDTALDDHLHLAVKTVRVMSVEP